MKTDTRCAVGLALLLLALPGTAAAAERFSHGAWDRVLRGYVAAGRVDYAGIRRRSRGVLDGYVGAVGRARLDGLTRAQKLAFYLNAYNALVVKAVVDAGAKLSRVDSVPGFFKVRKHRVAGRRVSLDELENRIIRTHFDDARTHFALVCAARSCPPLPSRAFVAETLDGTLDGLARDFINGRHGVRVERDRIRVSKLFRWYARDFKESAGSVGRYLARYHKMYPKRLVGAGPFDYLPYDWTLNGK